VVQERIEKRTIKFSKYSVYSSRAAATAHADVEFVRVFCRHGCFWSLNLLRGLYCRGVVINLYVRLGADVLCMRKNPQFRRSCEESRRRAVFITDPRQ
jgi:hypothetical protein